MNTHAFDPTLALVTGEEAARPADRIGRLQGQGFGRCKPAIGLMDEARVTGGYFMNLIGIKDRGPSPDQRSTMGPSDCAVFVRAGHGMPCPYGDRDG